VIASAAMKTTPEPQELTKEEAAELLGVSTRWLERSENLAEFNIQTRRKQAGRTMRTYYDREQIMSAKERRARGALVPMVAPSEPAGAALSFPAGTVTDADLLHQLVTVATAAAAAGLNARPLMVSGSERLTLSLAEAHESCGFSVESLRLAIKEGKLKARKVRGRRGWTILPADLRAYVDEVMT
jgi:hypothetical protein